MEKQKGVQLVIILVLVATVFTMSIAYAITSYTQTLKIDTTATVKAAKWDIHFKTDTYAESTGSQAAATKTLAATTGTYTVTLPKPGDYYEFTVDIENAGTFNATLDQITITETGDDATKNYVTTTVTYGGQSYTATTATGLGIALNAEATATAKVRIEYNEQADPTNLPSTDQTITVTTTFDYKQAA
ncbi:MAG: hypothetical protein IKQ29_03245 [Bacilli bacterium]|nr:hypothetical protein [Bacilli bacterium]